MGGIEVLSRSIWKCSSEERDRGGVEDGNRCVRVDCCRSVVCSIDYSIGQLGWHPKGIHRGGIRGDREII